MSATLLLILNWNINILIHHFSFFSGCVETHSYSLSLLFFFCIHVKLEVRFRIFEFSNLGEGEGVDGCEWVSGCGWVELFRCEGVREFSLQCSFRPHRDRHTNVRFRKSENFKFRTMILIKIRKFENSKI